MTLSATRAPPTVPHWPAPPASLPPRAAPQPAPGGTTWRQWKAPHADAPRQGPRGPRRVRGWIQEPRLLQAVGEPDEGRVVGMDGTLSPCTVRKTGDWWTLNAWLGCTPMNQCAGVSDAESNGPQSLQLMVPRRLI